jgi:hypothetical protein
LAAFAALYMAAAYLIGMVIFLAVLDYPSITDMSQKVTLLVEKQAVWFSTNLLMYVFFGIFLVVLSLALYDRVKTPMMQVAAAIGMIWAGSLIASGMVANAGIAPVVALYATDPAQAALTWQGIETVANGLGNANGEILGGLYDAAGQPGRAADRQAPQGLEYPRSAGWRGGRPLHHPRVDRPDRRFWPEPDHLVHLAGDRAAAQRSGQISTKSRKRSGGRVNQTWRKQ